MRRAHLAVLVLLLLLGTTVLQAQHPAAPPQSTPQAPQAPERKEAEKPKQKPAEAAGPSAELAEASREAAGEEEENAQFKMSPAVRWIARSTGLSPKAGYWVLYSIDFLIIAVLIYWFWRSNLPSMFRTRTASIRKTMDEARQASEDANRRLGSIEERLARLDQEIAAMRRTAEEEAAAEEARIRAAAEADKQKIVAAATQEIHAAERLAQRELKAYAAELAVSLAEKRIHVDAGTDRALVESFVQQLRGDGAGKGGS